MYKRSQFGIKKRFPLYWVCLKEQCPNSCCGPDFKEKKVRGLWEMPCHDQIPLSFNEMSRIVTRFGPASITRYPDELFYIKLSKDGSCPFWKNGLCEIQDIKPAVCRAYPLMDLDTNIGVLLDQRCLGFEEGEKKGMIMENETYKEMIESLIEIQQYRINRLKLELGDLNKHIPYQKHASL